MRSQYTTLRDPDLLASRSARGPCCFNRLHKLLSFDDFAEYSMFAIEVGSRHGSNEEL